MLAGYFHALRERYFLQLRDRGAGTSVATRSAARVRRSVPDGTAHPHWGHRSRMTPESD